jgi:hypothetical protein
VHQKKRPGRNASPRRKPSHGPRDSEIFPHRESPHNASCSAIGRDPVSLYLQPAVVYRYRMRSSFPCSPGSHLFSRTEQYNDLSLIQANTFFKTVLKYFAQLLCYGVIEHNQYTHQFFRHRFPRFVLRVTCLTILIELC